MQKPVLWSWDILGSNDIPLVHSASVDHSPWALWATHKCAPLVWSLHRIPNHVVQGTRLGTQANHVGWPMYSNQMRKPAFGPFLYGGGCKRTLPSLLKPMTSGTKCHSYQLDSCQDYLKYLGLLSRWKGGFQVLKLLPFGRFQRTACCVLSWENTDSQLIDIRHLGNRLLW